MKRFPVRAVLFDLDGTLVDSIADLASAIQSMLRELGQPPRELHEIKSFVGKGIPHLVHAALVTGRAEQSDEVVRRAIDVFHIHYSRENGRVSSTYPHAREVLARLKEDGFKLACVTNKAVAYTEPLLDKMQLSAFFDCVIGGDSLPQKKPQPEPLLQACRELSAVPATSIMVGDSANDALAARHAGMPVLLVSYGYSEGQPVDTIECDGLLSSLAELPQYLRLV